jgi:hypothetical protein
MRLQVAARAALWQKGEVLMQGLKVLLGFAVAGVLLLAAGPARAHDGCDNDRGSRYDGLRSGRTVYRNVGYRDYDGRYDRDDRRYDRREDAHDRHHDALDRRHDRLHDRLEQAHERAHERGFDSEYDHERFHDRLDRAHDREHRQLDRHHDADHHRIYGQHDYRYHGYRGYDPRAD